jgi:hypothetical protein
LRQQADASIARTSAGNLVVTEQVGVMIGAAPHATIIARTEPIYAVRKNSPFDVEAERRWSRLGTRDSWRSLTILEWRC